jgi:hypothetical protein
MFLTRNEIYYPFEEGLIQRCAHILMDNENRNCAFQFPCFETMYLLIYGIGYDRS